jgi:4-hydroxybenzoate polyprenyltransferase
MFFWIIVLPPYLDHFLFGSSTNYAYFSPTDFLNYILHFSGASFHHGQAMEIVVVLFAVIAYAVWVKRASFTSVGGRALVLVEIALLVVFTVMSLFIMATPGAYLPVGSLDGKPVFPSFDVTRYFQFHLFIFAYYLILLLGILAALAYLNNPRIFKRLALSLRPMQTLFFMGIVAAGIVTGWSSAAGDVYIERILSKPYWVNLEFVILSVISAMLAWLVSTMWNDLSDQSADSPSKAARVLASGLIGRRDLIGLSLVLMVLSLVLGALLSWMHLALLAAIYVLAFAYSLPPVRFKEHILSPLLIGAGAFLAFLYGFATPLSPIRLYLDNPDLVWPDSWNVLLPPLTGQAVVIGLYMFVGLVVGSMVTDIDGYQEDTRGRVGTIYTRLGLERGKKIVAVLVFLAALTPLALFHQVGDMVLFPLLGAAASLAFLRTGRSRYVLLIALVGMLYAAWRFLPSLG